MDHLEWLRLGDACRLSGRTQNQVYRLAALGKITTRTGESGRLEFRRDDLERLALSKDAGAARVPA